MAKAKQIPILINDILKESMGEKAPTVKNTDDLVMFASRYNLSDNADLKDAVWKTIVDKVQQVWVFSRVYKGKHRFIRKSVQEWGAWIEELDTVIGDAVENGSWADRQLNPFDVEDTGKVYAWYFKSLATWEHDLVLWDRKLISAFKGIEKFNALLSAMFVSLDNTVEKEAINLENLVLGTAIGGVLMNNKPAQCRDLLAEYQTLQPSAGITLDNCRFNEGFLIYCAEQITKVVDFMQSDYTTVYNVEGLPRNTPEGKMAVEVLTDFDNWLTYNMRSSVYNEKIVKMPNYTTIPYWQSGGDENKFEETSRINITNQSYKDVFAQDGAPLEINQNGIVAVIRDANVVSMCADRIKTLSVYNPRSECTNYFKKVETGFGINLSHNMVVFYLKGKDTV